MSNKTLKFNPDKHLYSIGGKNLISVSTLVKRFTPEFDPAGHICRACAKREGITPKEMKAKWEEMGRIASVKGIKFHKAVESYIKTGAVPEDENKDLIIQFSKIEFKGKLETEYMTFCEEDGLAGTLDLKENLDISTSNIFDFKTSKQILKKSKYGSFMLKPLEHLPDTNYHHFTMQINLYRHLLETMGLWVENMAIFHINPENNMIETHPIKFLPEETKEVLKYYKLSIEIEDFI